MNFPFMAVLFKGCWWVVAVDLLFCSRTNDQDLCGDEFSFHGCTFFKVVDDWLVMFYFFVPEQTIRICVVMNFPFMAILFWGYGLLLPLCYDQRLILLHLFFSLSFTVQKWPVKRVPTIACMGEIQAGFMPFLCFIYSIAASSLFKTACPPGPPWLFLPAHINMWF